MSYQSLGPGNRKFSDSFGSMSEKQNITCNYLGDYTACIRRFGQKKMVRVKDTRDSVGSSFGDHKSQSSRTRSDFGPRESDRI